MCSLLFKMMCSGYGEVQERAVIPTSSSQEMYGLPEGNERHTQHRRRNREDTDIAKDLNWAYYQLPLYLHC